MVLELHIWGPAYSLPSIDPQCLAAVIYLRQVIPRDRWVLIASCDDTLSPTKALPALRDGSTWVGGFRNIVDYLSKVSDGQWDLDAVNFDSHDRADITAFSSFVEANGQSILDLHLFVSSENYTSVTRPALSQFLQWPDQWFISPQRRSAAKARTDHLGLSSLDLDTANETQKTQRSTQSSSDVIPQSLRLSRQTITSLVKQPQHAARFRLDALADAFFAPLQQLLGKNNYMLEDQPSSLDCVALAYLALAYTPQMPHAWVAEAMNARYPELCQYVDRLLQEYFSGPVDLSHALLGSADGQGETIVNPHAEDRKTLPWRRPDQKGLTAAGTSFLSGTLNVLPLAGHFQKRKIMLRNGVTEGRSPSAPNSASVQTSSITPPFLALGSAIVAMGAYLLYSGFLSETTSPNNTLSDMGEAGAMLDMAAFGGYSNSPADELQLHQRSGRVPVGLEVDVEVDQPKV